ncbi:bleomycin hydrolase-like [Actinia tenebrosa]|uniref:Bleomycin hydrolase n=1 Tax=Actinia tenebrosa TaxID=6105 RepID=A0A6P8I4L2_ACTTE|nr:bleomycin hydrolase-like [Actinia tenebrosa]
MAEGSESALAGLSTQQISQIQTAFNCDPKNQLSLNLGTRNEPLDLCLSRQVVEKTNHVFNHKVNEVKPMTNQKSSGRCWIFALLNCVRQKFVQNMNLDEMEFSQQYLFFWDKIERSYFFLNNYVELAKKNEDPDGRLMMYLLSNPMNDGGQWEMLVSLVEKYGLIPKSVWPDSTSAIRSRRMNAILNNKHRECAMVLRKMVKDGASDEEIELMKNKMMAEVYRIVAICLGTPPSTFTWEYYDKSKNYKKIEGLTPLKFYNDYIKPVFTIRDKVCIVNDPRNEYNKLYTVEYLGNFANGPKVVYLNQPIEVLKYLAAASLRDNEAVWFGCDVGKHFEGKLGVLDLEIHNYDLVFGISLLGLDKAQRLVYGESLMTHAMTFTGLSYQDTGDQSGEKSGVEQKSEGEEKPVTLKPVTTTKWRVENSWGDDKGDKGYLVMTDNWFSEYVYEVVVDKKYVPAELLAILKQEPVVLPAWDPMGALACVHCGETP